MATEYLQKHHVEEKVAAAVAAALKARPKDPVAFIGTFLAGRSAAALEPKSVETKPIKGQKPGTSGLRKKTREFMGENYLNNFVQSVFNALAEEKVPVEGGTLVVSGDGRYYNKEAIQVIIKMAAAAGVSRVWCGSAGLLSTPAMSAVIRERGIGGGKKPFGGFILSASHNPGGIDCDFGIKYNGENGGPAPEKVTNLIFGYTEKLESYAICPVHLELPSMQPNAAWPSPALSLSPCAVHLLPCTYPQDLPDLDLSKASTHTLGSTEKPFTVEVFPCVEDHVALLKKVFDFPAIKTLFERKDFTMMYDSMHGVQGPYAKAIFLDEFGASPTSLINADPKEDFGGKDSASHGHADPNLTHAVELVAAMGLDKMGQKIATEKTPPSFGAAADGDADRNMIMGSQFFCSHIPYFEVPTGWKFFGNLMDSGTDAFPGKPTYTPFICGEESFGTGGDHVRVKVREKDGMWAVLAWLQILASKNTDPSKPLFGVEDILKAHWAEYGRNYYARYDYEGVDKKKAEDMMQAMVDKQKGMIGTAIDGMTIKDADMFAYNDSVDGSVSKNQGVRFIFEDGSRFVFRLSGTGVDGATIRMYLEKYAAPGSDLDLHAFDVVKPIAKIALEVSELATRTDRTEPSVIT